MPFAHTRSAWAVRCEPSQTLIQISWRSPKLKTFGVKSSRAFKGTDTPFAENVGCGAAERSVHTTPCELSPVVLTFQLSLLKALLAVTSWPTACSLCRRMLEWAEALQPRRCTLPSLYVWYISSQQHWLKPKPQHSRLRAKGSEAQHADTFQENRLRSDEILQRSVEGSSPWRSTAHTGSKRRESRGNGTQSLGEQSRRGPAASPDGATLQQAVLAGNSQQAIQIFSELQRLDSGSLPEPDVCDKLLQLLCKGRDFPQCWKVYQALRPVQLRYSTLAAVMDAAIRGRDQFRALEAFRDMQARGLQPNKTTWCYLISSFTKVRRKGRPYADTAYQLWLELLQLQPDGLDASSFATGMMACTGVGRMEEARGLLEEMRRAGFRPDVRAYNILLKGHARERGMASLQELFEEIKRAGLSPSGATYNTLVDAYADAGLLLQARQTLREAEADGLRLDVWAYSSLIKGYVRGGELPLALSVLDEMQAAGVHPNVVTFSTLLDGCVRAGEMAEAEALLRDMQRRRISANVITYNMLLRGYAERGDLKAVRDVLQRMGEAGVHPREDTFNTLMEGALQNQDADLVPQLFQQLISLDLEPDSLSYTALITALARLSKPDVAVQAAGKLEQSQGLDVISLNALVAALANANRMVEAEEQLQRAVVLARSQGRSPPIGAYGAVLKAYARLRDADSAMDLLEEFQNEGGEPDDILVDMAVTACVRGGQFKRALKFVRAMERAGKNLDKQRIKQTLEVVLKSKEMAYRKPSQGTLPRNENLERFKFWLGLPNNYYSSDDGSSPNY